MAKFADSLWCSVSTISICSSI